MPQTQRSPARGMGEFRLSETVSEPQWQETVRAECRYYQALMYHTHDSRRSDPGLPDCIIITKDNRLLFAELKRDKTNPEPMQRIWLDALVKVGQQVFVWRPKDQNEVVDILEGKPAPEGGWPTRWIPKATP